MPRRIGMLAWAVVAIVALLVLGLVLALSLFPRLNAGQRVVDGLRPAFAPERVHGDTESIKMVSNIVDVADPIVNEEGGAAAEVPKLVTYVSSKSGLTSAQVLAALQAKFPYVTHLLVSLPLSAVTAELPGLVAFLGTVLGVPPADVQTLLKTQFPAINQVVTHLPTVTDGWENVKGTENLTRFDGSEASTVPQIRDYFAGDVVPAVVANQKNFDRVDTYWPPVRGIPILLTVIGFLVLLFARVMFTRTAKGRVTRQEALVTSTAVLMIGVLVLGLVFGLRLYPRLDGGAKLISTTQPIFTTDRVEGDIAAVKMVSEIVDVADPIVTQEGGAASEVFKLVTTLSAKTKIPGPVLITMLETKFPHTANLLQALPLTQVTAELPKLVAFLAATLKASPEQVQAALGANFPKLAQVVAHLPTVTNGWNNVAGLEHLTRFDGKPVRTTVEMRDYLQDDVVPAIANTRADYRKLADTGPALNVFPPLLTMLGLLVVIYGILMIPLVGMDPDLRERQRQRQRQRPVAASP